MSLLPIQSGWTGIQPSTANKPITAALSFKQPFSELTSESLLKIIFSQREPGSNANEWVTPYSPGNETLLPVGAYYRTQDSSEKRVLLLCKGYSQYIVSPYQQSRKDNVCFERNNQQIIHI